MSRDDAGGVKVAIEFFFASLSPFAKDEPDYESYKG